MTEAVAHFVAHSGRGQGAEPSSGLPAGCDEVAVHGSLGGLLRHCEREGRELVEHHNAERPHRGLGNDSIAGRPDEARGAVVVNERLSPVPKPCND